MLNKVHFSAHNLPSREEILPIRYPSFFSLCSIVFVLGFPYYLKKSSLSSTFSPFLCHLTVFTTSPFLSVRPLDFHVAVCSGSARSSLTKLSFHLLTPEAGLLAQN